MGKKIIVVQTPDNPTGLEPDWVQREFTQKPGKSTLKIITKIDDQTDVISKPMEVHDLKITFGEDFK